MALDGAARPPVIKDIAAPAERCANDGIEVPLRK